MDNNVMPNVTFEEELEQAPLPEGYSFDAGETATTPINDNAVLNTVEQSPIEQSPIEQSPIEKAPLPEGYSLEAVQEQEKAPLPEGYALEGEVAQEPSDYSDILNLPRHAKRFVARGIETVGDVTKATVDFAAKAADVGLGAARNLVRQVGRDTPGLPYQEDLPLTGEGSTRALESVVSPMTGVISGETIKKYVTSPIFGKETITPKNRLESAGDEIVKTVTALATPSIFGKGVALKNAVKLAGVGEVAKELYKSFAKEVGFNEEAGDTVKLGAMFATSVLSGKPSTNIDQLYKEAEIALKEGKNTLTKESLNPIFKAVTNLVNRTDLSKAAKTDIKAIIKKIKKTGKAEDIIALKKYVNSFYKSTSTKSYFRETLKRAVGIKDVPKNDLNTAITGVSKASKDSLLSWGKKANPSFVEKFFPAEELFAADKTFDKARSSLEKVTKTIKSVNPSLLFMLKVGEGVGTAAGFVAKKMLIKKGIELTNYYLRSPLFRAQSNKLFGEIAKGAIRIGTIESVNKTLNDLDEARRMAESYEN